jgi:hypothetical protein
MSIDSLSRLVVRGMRRSDTAYFLGFCNLMEEKENFL